REDLDGCGLAGAVGAEQSEDLALADGDGHPVESLDGWLAATRRIRLDQVRGLDGKGGCCGRGGAGSGRRGPEGVGHGDSLGEEATRGAAVGFWCIRKAAGGMATGSTRGDGLVRPARALPRLPGLARSRSW